MISGRLIAAGRSLTGVSQKDLADAAGISVSELALMEANDAALLPPSATVEPSGERLNISK